MDNKQTRAERMFRAIEAVTAGMESGEYARYELYYEELSALYDRHKHDSWGLMVSSYYFGFYRGMSYSKRSRRRR